MENKDYKITVEAKVENLEKLTQFADRILNEAGCLEHTQIQIDVALEEIFVNIASYAYAPGQGDATMIVKMDEDLKRVSLTFIDEGTPYDPLARQDPDVTLSAEERGIGGLGIYMVKKSMDDVRYEYKDGKNILTIVKGLSDK